MKMPNFLIIGAAKAGTSSLHYYLSQHPDVFMSAVKEPRFFALEGEVLDFRNPDQSINHDSITALGHYQSLFTAVMHESAIGEASPLYLYSRKACDRIYRYIPQTKLIVVLRNPVDRAFSCYTHLLREGYETLTFEEGLKAEEARIVNNWAHLWHYKRGGLYYQQLKPYFDTFGRDKLAVYLYEDFKSDSVSLVKDIFSYLEVDNSFVPDMSKRNVSGIPKSMVLQKFLKRKNLVRSSIKTIFPNRLKARVAKSIREWNVGDKPALSLETSNKLAQYFREENSKLQKLIQRDLSSWLP